MGKWLLFGVLLPGVCWADIQVKVVDQGGQVAVGAFVLIGKAKDNPFAGNWIKTGSDGIAHFSANPVNDEPITVSKSGFPNITYMNQSGGAFQLQLPEASPVGTASLSGEFTGWQNLGVDNNAYFGLFVPMMTINKLIEFQITDFISAKTDVMQVLGQDLNVPSNISLPTQDVSYNFIPLTLDKPLFTLPVPLGGPKNFVGISGHFPFEQVAGELRAKKTFFDVLNEMTVEHATTLTHQSIVGDMTGLQLDINQDSIAPCVQVSSEQAPDNRRVIAVSALLESDLEGQPLRPTDIKVVDGQPQVLGCSVNDQRPLTVLNIAMGNYKDSQGNDVRDRGLSVVIDKSVARQPSPVSIKLDSYFAIPQITLGQGGQVSVSTVERAGISPQATLLYAVLSDLSSKVVGNRTVEEIHPKWIVFSHKADFTLPQLPSTSAEDANLSGSQRWQTTWLGTDEPSPATSVGYDFFDQITHASTNSADF